MGIGVRVGGGGGEVRVGRGRLYLTLLCHNQNGVCI